MPMNLSRTASAALLSAALLSIHQRLVGLLCDPEGEASIAGTPEENRLIGAALRDMEANALDVRGLGQREEPDFLGEVHGEPFPAPAVTDFLGDSILRATEEMARLEGHNPQYNVWLDHLRELLEIQSQRLRRPRFLTYNLATDWGSPDGDMTAFAVRTADGAMHVATQVPKTDAQVKADGEELHRTVLRDAGDEKDVESPILTAGRTDAQWLRQLVCTTGSGPMQIKRPRYGLVADAFHCSPRDATQLCARFGFDPDEKV